MLRYIANRVAGRRKSTDESLSVSEATELLGSLNGSTRGKVNWGSGITEFGLSGVAPREMVDFVEEKFSTEYGGYADIQHQVYSGESGDKHYFKMAKGNVEGTFGATIVRGMPFRKATINFLVQEK